MPPPMSSALRGCWRYAIAAAMRAAWFVTPGDFAKSIMLSALSCWSQTPPVERSALMPAPPARSTHGSLVKMSPPLASYGCKVEHISSRRFAFSRMESTRTYTEILPVLRDGGKVGLRQATVVR